MSKSATLIFEGNEIPLGGDSSGGVNFTPGETMELSEDNVLNVKVPNKGAITEEEYEQLSEEEKSNGIYAVYDPAEQDYEEVPQKSLYEQFVEHGYTGTEDDFNALIASGPWLPTSDAFTLQNADSRYLKLSGGTIYGLFRIGVKTGSSEYLTIFKVIDKGVLNISAYIKEQYDISQGDCRINGVAVPVNDYEAANKKYVDDTIGTRQTKLIGSQGQLVSFDASGNAIAQNAPESMTSADLDIWSTTERVVGTWYDGRPIYERTFTYLDKINANQTVQIATNFTITKLISANGFSINQHSSTTNVARYLFRISSNNIYSAYMTFDISDISGSGDGGYLSYNGSSKVVSYTSGNYEVLEVIVKLKYLKT